MAKTDRINASVLGRIGAALDLQPHPGSSEVDQDLRELSLARRALIKDRTAARNREQVAQNAIIRRHLKARLSQIEKQIGEIEKAMAAIVAADETLARRREILASIPGIGLVRCAAGDTRKICAKPRAMAAKHHRHVALTEPLTKFVDREVAEGRYASASEVMRAALRLLTERENAGAGLGEENGRTDG